ncbi:hypothetical protein JAO71_05330 [Olleya sp. YSTF-M6]|uniref:YD repeat-containing protein n=1 Tax=Olleya sediminilitoris TaxID=2795739 RepID=A0ABS1WJC7_9FLAO|nr:hypothetical protein [Olleya sediminilitoris]MBL7559222.1 hypothetical protein [Olleya sediminilitoris]
MKKTLLILLTVTLITSCNNETLEGFELADNTTSNNVQLTNYTFDVDTEIIFFGPVNINTDFSFNTNNKVSTLDVETIFSNVPFYTSGIINRDSSGKILNAQSFEGDTPISQTSITYSTGSNISQINFNDLTDDTEDYTYNFTISGNSITKTQDGNPVTTVYTTDNLGRLITKESFEDGESIQIENLVYDTNGNCISVITSGELNNNTIYGYDTFTNPLKDGFSDQYWLTILDDDYEAEAGPAIVQFHSTNNWINVSSEATTVNFTMTYDTENRILSRSGTFTNEGIEATHNENFNYVN